MIQGTMSNVGKSIITAGLCRVFRQDGYKVAPFKSQNMAHPFITDEGLEIGRSQAVQAEAAGVAPSVYMNPILLKPVSDSGSQVVVNGVNLGHMGASEYFARKKTFIPDIMRAYEYLLGHYDIVVIEGAGSPAEINLKKDDIVNMGLAKMTNSPVLLVGDIDPGGVFAQFAGTLMLLGDDERDIVKGLIINKFRGDLELLRPGISMLEDITGKPVIGTIPYLRVDIEDEDSLAAIYRKRQGLPDFGGKVAVTAGTGDSADGNANAAVAADGNANAAAELAAYKESQYNALADALRVSLDMEFIYKLIQ